MADLEERLAETLARHADDAPPGHGLAAGARGRARRRRRTRVGGAVVAVALAVGVPAAVAVWPRPAPQPAPATATATDRVDLRWESWHGVTVQVPAAWPAGPRRESEYGVSFQAVDPDDSYSWPVVHQDAATWPQPNAVGARALAGVLVTVAAPSAEEAQAVLNSAHAIDNRDPNGCPAFGDYGKGRARPGTVSVCRYLDSQLEQSEQLRGADATAALAAVEEAAEPVECEQTATAERVSLTTSNKTWTVYLGGCAAIADGNRPTRMRGLTADLVYWAISPGSTADLTGLTLPERLRGE